MSKYRFKINWFWSITGSIMATLLLNSLLTFPLGFVIVSGFVFCWLAAVRRKTAVVFFRQILRRVDAFLTDLPHSEGVVPRLRNGDSSRQSLDSEK